MSLSERYRRWYDYERNAHALVLESLETVPDEGRSSADFRHAVNLLAHLVMARRLWLYRLGVIPEPPHQLFPHDMRVPVIVSTLLETEATWAAWLESLEDADLDRVIRYQALDGPSFNSRVEDILTQLFGHSWYHRGQIAQLVRRLDGDPAVTDFVYWSREPITE